VDDWQSAQLGFNNADVISLGLTLTINAFCSAGVPSALYLDDVSVSP